MNVIFERNILNLYGKEGKIWLNSLPDIANLLARQWNLSNIQVFPHLSYNYVASCIQNNVPIVLKIGFDKKELSPEAAALQAFAGHGCINLLDQNLDLGALLLQKATPGTRLKKLFPEKDDYATDIMCNIIKQLQSTNNYNTKDFPHISDWLKLLENDWNLPQQYLVKARSLSKQLLATTQTNILLHADLHHENILLHENDNWIAIDPKGAIGDPAYEVGAAIRNPIPEILNNNEAKNIIKHRIRIFAQTLGFNPERIFAWTYVQTALAACWTINDERESTSFINSMDILENISTDYSGKI